MSIRKDNLYCSFMALHLSVIMAFGGRDDIQEYDSNNQTNV